MSDVSAVSFSASNPIMEMYRELTEEPAIKNVTEQDKKTASLANSDGFKALQQYIDQQIEFLSDISVDPAKDTPETVGFRYLATSVTVQYLKIIRDLPEHTAEMLKPLKETEDE